MSAALKPPVMTPAEFLAWEEQQEERFEFDGLAVVSMPGGTRAHAVIVRNLAVAVGSRLRGRPCELFLETLKVTTRNGYRYPDGFVTCTPGDNASTVVTDPVVLFEVSSPGTESVDAITKNLEYAAIPSVRRYVQLPQDRMGATVFERIGEDWVGHVMNGDAVLHMPEIGIAVPLAELYEGLDLPPG